ncbi:hypothetical protein JWG39_09925 [Desulforhopalus vacuolatus]|uniref:hypothetical protein n=1 Tax=Desulforhopalus vacuolatus TaxID=40414 RepID=UPI001962C870|nr:hypothetical protein [Desulforhopalus vacuolatus]MBM9520131.1 hypothetical protein [Desulforhopalus vacuolatus]
MRDLQKSYSRNPYICPAWLNAASPHQTSPRHAFSKMQGESGSGFPTASRPF